MGVGSEREVWVGTQKGRYRLFSLLTATVIVTVSEGRGILGIKKGDPFLICVYTTRQSTQKQDKKDIL